MGEQDETPWGSWIKRLRLPVGLSRVPLKRPVVPTDPKSWKFADSSQRWQLPGPGRPRGLGRGRERSSFGVAP